MAHGVPPLCFRRFFEVEFIHFRGRGHNVSILNQDLIDPTPLCIAVIAIAHFGFVVDWFAFRVMRLFRGGQLESLGISIIPFRHDC